MEDVAVGVVGWGPEVVGGVVGEVVRFAWSGGHGCSWLSGLFEQRIERRWEYLGKEFRISLDLKECENKFVKSFYFSKCRTKCFEKG